MCKFITHSLLELSYPTSYLQWTYLSTKIVAVLYVASNMLVHEWKQSSVTQWMYRTNGENLIEIHWWSAISVFIEKGNIIRVGIHPKIIELVLSQIGDNPWVLLNSIQRSSYYFYHDWKRILLKRNFIIDWHTIFRCSMIELWILILTKIRKLILWGDHFISSYGVVFIRFMHREELELGQNWTVFM